MSKTLIGIVTFGNFRFTLEAIRSAVQTVKNDFEIFVVVGKPGDTQTLNFCKDNGIPHKVHTENLGFPASLNDIYDYGWKENNFDYIVTMGNDVIAYPKAIDLLIITADEEDYDWVCSKEYDVRALVREHPELKSHFKGAALHATEQTFQSKPWEVFNGYDRHPYAILGPGMSDTHNLSLYSKSVFDAIGYIDVNFYPAYYEDNDYCRRGINAAKIKSCTVNNSFYFHFWSRTIHQEEGGSNHGFFRENRLFYLVKWGGDFGNEQWEVPFNGRHYPLTDDILLEPTINIQSREQEKDIINYWRSKQKK